MSNFNYPELITAMITPFQEDKSIDHESALKIAEYLVDHGNSSILIAGTTGESPTLTYEEEITLFKKIKHQVGHKVNMILGAGSNSTKTAIGASREAEQAGADAILSVVPYYNKPSQKGIITHFSAIAQATSLPIIIYNIQGRTGINATPETIAELAASFKNIVAVKQSNPDLDQITQIRILTDDSFKIYSGDDSLTLPMFSLGAHGVVSVASHVVGVQIVEMMQAFRQGNNKKALELQKELFPIFKIIFAYPSPAPIKYVMYKLGLAKNILREPMVPVEDLTLMADLERVVNKLAVCK